MLIHVLAALLVATALACTDIGAAEASACDGVNTKFLRSATKEAPDVVREYGWMIRAAADEFSVSAIYLAAKPLVESMNNPDVVNKEGAIGLTQVIPRYALADVRRIYPDLYFSDDLKDPYNNLRVAAAYMAALRDHYGFEEPIEVTVGYYTGPNKLPRMSKEEIHSHFYLRKTECVVSLSEIPVLIN